MIEIQIDLQAEMPIYRQIALEVQRLVVEGGLNLGDQLPPMRSLAGALGVHFTTVARAYRALEAQGWLAIQQGRGAYIWGSGWPTQRAARREQAFAALSRSYVETALGMGFSAQEIHAEIQARLAPDQQESAGETDSISG